MEVSRDKSKSNINQSDIQPSASGEEAMIRILGKTKQVRPLYLNSAVFSLHHHKSVTTATFLHATYIQRSLQNRLTRRIQRGGMPRIVKTY
jgi:hypothetical protein